MRYSMNSKIVSIAVILSILLFSCVESTLYPNRTSAKKEEAIYYSTAQGIYKVRSDGTGTTLIADGARLHGVVGSTCVAQLHGGGADKTVLLDSDGNVVRTLPLEGKIPQLTPRTLSPTGDKLLYVIIRGSGSAAVGELHSINHDGTNDIVIEQNAVAFDAPVFSPDGKRVAYLQKGSESNPQDRKDNLYVCNVDGTDKKLLLTDARESSMVRTGGVHGELKGGLYWSPDGSRLVCIGYDGNGKHGILIVDASTGASTRVQAEGTAEWGAPAFSPDGSSIVYYNASLDKLVGTTEAVVVGIDGIQKAAIQLIGNTNDIIIDTFEPVPGFGCIFQWSSDGAHIVATELIGRKLHLKVIDVSARAAREIESQLYNPAYWLR